VSKSEQKTPPGSATLSKEVSLMLPACHSLPTSRPKLLVVEDDPNIRSLISTILTASGYGVRSSEDGFSALEQIRDEMPDIVLSDLFMPGMSGFELLSVIRRRFPAIRVVAMSSAYSGRNVPVGIAADAFYEKATNVKALLAIIDDIQRSQRSASAHTTSLAPIWIASATKGHSGHACVLLACTECLRTFSQPLSQRSTMIYETTCPFCSMPIHYALVEPAYALA